MPGFIQSVEFETDDIDAVKKALEDFRKSNPRVITFTSNQITEDRDSPGTYVSIVEFNSYEEAMAQSNHPDLSRFAQNTIGELTRNRRFRNLDVR
jgi:hypothetical protein